MQETTNLSLELYEPTDNANLEDGYNASMRKIDQRDGEISTLISGLTATVQSIEPRVSEVEGVAAAADAKADIAAASAAAAVEDAVAAVSQLNGAHFYHIQNDERGTKWSAGTWADSTCSFNAAVIFDDETGHGVLFGTVFAQSTGTTQGTSWQRLPVVNLTDWQVDTAEGHTVYCPCCVVNNAWGPGINFFQMYQNQLVWTPVNQEGTLAAGEAITGNFAFPVVRRS